MWDLTYPTAIEKSQIAQYLIPEALRGMFPMWAQGDMLDMHGANRGLMRKPAQPAICMLTFKGAAGTVIPSGTVAGTIPYAGEKPIMFETETPCTLNADSVSVRAHALAAGTMGNVAAGRVCSMPAPVKGITSVLNVNAAYGGTDREADEAFRSRIVEFDAMQGRNYVGSAADYRRWALEVNGVGDAKVMPAQDDSGVVDIIITASDGTSASPALCDAVRNHIMRPDNPESRLSPVNANVSIRTPEVLHIAVSAAVTLESATPEAVKAELTAALNRYFMSIDDKIIRITKVGALLSAIEGVTDYADLKLNGTGANIKLNDMQLPVSMPDEVSIV